MWKMLNDSNMFNSSCSSLMDATTQCYRSRFDWQTLSNRQFL